MMQDGEMAKESGKQADGMVQIRPMSPADIPAAAALERQSFSEPWSEQGFEDALLGQQNIFLVAEPEDDRIAGYIGLYGSFDEGDITNVAVRKDRQREGIGAFLMQSLIRLAAERDVTTIHQEVRVGNETAIRLL